MLLGMPFISKELESWDYQTTHINIHRDVDIRIPHPFLQLPNHPVHPNSINVSRFDDVKATANVVSHVLLAS